MLCCHSLRILFHKDVELLSNKYILKRWTRQARSDTFNDNNGKQIVLDPRLESSNRKKQLCPMLLRLAEDASDYPEACALVYQWVLELSKKVAETRLNKQSHDTHDSTCEVTKYVAKPSTSKGIGFKKKNGTKMKKNKLLKSWVDDLKQKRRKVKPLQPSMHKAQDDYNFPSLETLDLSQPILDGIGLLDTDVFFVRCYNDTGHRLSMKSIDSLIIEKNKKDILTDDSFMIQARPSDDQFNSQSATEISLVSDIVGATEFTNRKQEGSHNKTETLNSHEPNDLFMILDRDSAAEQSAAPWSMEMDFENNISSNEANKKLTELKQIKIIMRN
ncbi:hypothetical protein SESBI_01385 [Sesbania bispinosa]|nr:hypothetical protein SESBI_01385 [Sesbania bispinosa]